MKLLYAIAVLMLVASTTLRAQEDFISRKVSYTLSSGNHDGQSPSNARTSDEAEDTYHYMAYQTTVSRPGSPFMRLYFGDTNLGKHSFLTITSVEDGIEQRLDAESI